MIGSYSVVPQTLPPPRNILPPPQPQHRSVSWYPVQLPLDCRSPFLLYLRRKEVPALASPLSLPPTSSLQSSLPPPAPLPLPLPATLPPQAFRAPTAPSTSSPALPLPRPPPLAAPERRHEPNNSRPSNVAPGTGRVQ
ncbi:hypothetical protein E2C01_001039 [Portunus trituberculatus]|uniref:Uncharacterized protein n=1 Tax=Portunus trituberculatus TaxID=210409 RepID=A0A5B7CFP9_PORTR|nr:hypothetical protein [Portunus trituberculatus]